MCFSARLTRPLGAGLGLCSLVLAGGCTGDAAMDASLASVTGALVAAATGDYSTAQQLASLGQTSYSQALTGSYRYQGNDQDKDTGSTSTGVNSTSPVSTATAFVARSYGASMDDLGERIDVARGALGTNCPRSLGYVEPALPRFSDPQLEQLRSTVVTASVDDLLAQQESMGWSTDQTVTVWVDQYDQSLRLAEEAVQTFRDTSGVDPEPLLGQIRNGTYPFLPSQEGVHDNSARAIVMAWYQMVLTQEMALAISCHGAA